MAVLILVLGIVLLSSTGLEAQVRIQNFLLKIFAINSQLINLHVGFLVGNIILYWQDCESDGSLSLWWVLL